MSIHHHKLARVAPLLAAVTGLAATACSSSHDASNPPASPSQPQPQASSVAPAQRSSSPPAASGGAAAAQPRSTTQQGGAQQDAELVVSHEIVSRCPTLRLVKAHVEEFDPNTVWLAVLESIGECMSEGGPMAAQSIGVSGDEEHRHVVREVLGSRGVAPTRVVATPASEGAAECQGGDCARRVELTLISQ
jgi:hypothetical protein